MKVFQCTRDYVQDSSIVVTYSRCCVSRFVVFNTAGLHCFCMYVSTHYGCMYICVNIFVYYRLFNTIVDIYAVGGSRGGTEH